EESERRQKEFAERTKMFAEALDLDEMMGQLLTSEGFASVEEIAYVPLSELASIEGFDEETAGELQARALKHLADVEEALDEERKALGVEDDLKTVPGVTSLMLVAFGKNDIKSVEDLAGCATDDLTGWTERKDGETVRYPGALDGFEIDREGAEHLIMQARVAAGWISADEGEAEEAEADDTENQT
ncbi:MAG: transcription termination/antitermination protein NusA, partial [Rhodobacterales bacterium 17-64-5]